MHTSARRVALLCLDPWRLTECYDNRPFNYAVRRIQAAILGDPRLKDIELKLIESTSDDEDEFVQRIEEFDPDLIGVSAYVWSFPQLLEICRRVKRHRPDRTIIFGGPSSAPEMFELPQHMDGAQVVDAIVKGEGEEIIQNILLTTDRSRASLARVKGIYMHDGDAWRYTGEANLGSPDSHPSPYELGLMPEGVTCQIESFRGCPLSCTYCEWGDTGVTSRTFGYEYLKRELEYLYNMEVKGGTWLVDPGLNLNSKAFRNLAKAEYEVGALRKHGDFRCEIYPSSMTDEHLKFLEHVRARYAGVGLQSFDAEVLKGMERPFSEDRFNRVVEDVAAVVPDITIEIILGLPGDDPDTFKRTMEKALKLPVSIRVFHCLVLPSALMTRAPASFEMKFDPFTLQMISCKGWSKKQLEDTRRWLDDNGESEDKDIPHAGTWKFPRFKRIEGWKTTSEKGLSANVLEHPFANRNRPQEGDGGGKTAVPILPPVPAALHDVIRRHVAQIVPWTLTSAQQLSLDVNDGIAITIERPEGAFVLRIGRQDDFPSHFKAANGIAYTYESAGKNGSSQFTNLDPLNNLIQRLHPIMRAVIFGMQLKGPKRAPGTLAVIQERPATGGGSDAQAIAK